MVGPVPVDGHQAQVPEMCTGKVTFAASPVLRRGLSREYIHSASGVRLRPCTEGTCPGSITAAVAFEDGIVLFDASLYMCDKSVKNVARRKTQMRGRRQN
ncbi:hypothetical protein B296_00038615 [Ensete ventricosum]|uniref:Uncharacterized protein n=1 Tax=Ensete ventricosum TaxID=4639 RepID=A0A426Z069_ENSVE|nr:hypothetical protein B296_00038615 [Ensete ventricosum]